MAETVSNRFKKALADAGENWPSGDYRMLLLTGSVVADPDDNTLADVIAAPNVEASDGSYARQTLASKTNTQDDTNNRANLDCATADFGALDNETPTAAVIYRHVDGTNANDLFVSLHDTGFGAASNGAGYTVTTPNDALRLT